jgi:hypothetical protein
MISDSPFSAAFLEVHAWLFMMMILQTMVGPFKLIVGPKDEGHFHTETEASLHYNYQKGLWFCSYANTKDIEEHTNLCWNPAHLNFIHCLTAHLFI